MSDENTKLIIEYYNEKYGEPIGYAGLLKAICVASIKIKDVFPLSILTISTSQSFKSRTSIETACLFPKDFVNFGSDFTIHSLMKNFDNGKKMQNKIGSINDMVVLFTSKSSRGKDRLLGAFAESLSEGEYTYSDFQSNIEWIPKRWGLCSNITFEKYEIMQQELVESTFDERLLKFYYKVPIKTWDIFNIERDKRFCMKIPRLNIKKFSKISKPVKDENERLNVYAEKLRIASLSQSKGKCFDKIKSLLYGNAALNNRDYLEDCDYELLDNMLPYFSDPHSKKPIVLRMLTNGVHYKEILKILGYSGQSADLIYRWKKQFILRGLLEDKKKVDNKGDKNV